MNIISAVVNLYSIDPGTEKDHDLSVVQDTQSLVNALDPDRTSLHFFCPSDPKDVFYGVDVHKCFACLPVDLTPDDCTNYFAMSGCPNISHEDSSFYLCRFNPTSHNFHLAVSSIPGAAGCCNTISHLHALFLPIMDGESLLSSSLLSSFATSSNVCDQ